VDAASFIAEQLGRNNKIFLKTLEDFPEGLFHTDLPAGGHSVAWHALHIADWTRILVPAKLEDVSSELRFAYLGWEDAAFAQPVLGDSPAMHVNSKADILEYVKSELERATRN
jgi:DinB superfamily